MFLDPTEDPKGFDPSIFSQNANCVFREAVTNWFRDPRTMGPYKADFGDGVLLTRRESVESPPDIRDVSVDYFSYPMVEVIRLQNGSIVFRSGMNLDRQLIAGVDGRVLDINYVSMTVQVTLDGQIDSTLKYILKDRAESASYSLAYRRGSLNGSPLIDLGIYVEEYSYPRTSELRSIYHRDPNGVTRLKRVLTIRKDPPREVPWILVPDHQHPSVVNDLFQASDSLDSRGKENPDIFIQLASKIRRIYVA